MNTPAINPCRCDKSNPMLETIHPGPMYRWYAEIRCAGCGLMAWQHADTKRKAVREVVETWNLPRPIPSDMKENG